MSGGGGEGRGSNKTSFEGGGELEKGKNFVEGWGKVSLYLKAK